MSKNMWKCRKCGEEIKEGWSHCPQCGSPQNESSTKNVDLFEISDSENIMEPTPPPVDLADRPVPAGKWRCKSCGKLNKNDSDECEHCLKIRSYTNPEFHRISEKPLFSEPAVYSKIPASFTRHEQPTSVTEEYITRPANAIGGSWAANFLRILAVLLFILGIVVAIKAGNIEKTYDLYYSSRTYSEFSFWAFLVAYIPYLLGGAFTLCASELFENIKRIADSLESLKTVKK